MNERLKRKFFQIFMKLKFPVFTSNDIFIHPFSYVDKSTVIGKGTNINGKCFISGCKEAKVIIGKYCAIAHNLRVRTRNHYMGYANLQDKFQNRYGFYDISAFKGDTSIGNACWIGDNVMILPGVRIGDGAVIGAGSIVSKNIPDFAIAVGSPARVIKYRFSEKTITQLLEIKWWDWSESKVKRNDVFFNTDLTEYNGILANLIK